MRKWSLPMVVHESFFLLVCCVGFLKERWRLFGGSQFGGGGEDLESRWAAYEASEEGFKNELFKLGKGLHLFWWLVLIPCALPTCSRLQRERER